MDLLYMFPSDPVQLRMKFACRLIGGVVTLPLLFVVPLDIEYVHPAPLVILHEFARTLSTVQVRVTVSPIFTLGLLELRLRVEQFGGVPDVPAGHPVTIGTQVGGTPVNPGPQFVQLGGVPTVPGGHAQSGKVPTLPAGQVFAGTQLGGVPVVPEGHVQLGYVPTLPAGQVFLAHEGEAGLATRTP